MPGAKKSSSASWRLAGASSAVSKGGEERDVVCDLEYAARNQRRGHGARREHRARNGWADRRSEATRNGSEAGRGGPLGRCDDAHHERTARRHVHLRKQASRQEEGERQVEPRRERRADQEQARRDVREHHGVDHADAPRERSGGELRPGGEESRPEEERAGRGERHAMPLEQPEREERVEYQPTRK